VVRSGSKVGSKYAALNASTNDAFGPTLKGATLTQLSDDIECVMEIVIDGVSKEAIDEAMRRHSSRLRLRRSQWHKTHQRRKLRW
jgi:formylmethanofuran--tetrahydromethanopterin N-formyltransferase